MGKQEIAKMIVEVFIVCMVSGNDISNLQNPGSKSLDKEAHQHVGDK